MSLRWISFLLLIVPFFAFSQNSTRIDSTDYYLELANFNAKINNYRNSLEYTQEAILYARRHRLVYQEAKAYQSLGQWYLDIQKCEDAQEAFRHSIDLYNTLKPSSNQAYTYYLYGLSLMEREYYIEAEKSFDKAKTIYRSLQIDDASPMLDLQKGILYRHKKMDKEAMDLFGQILAIDPSKDVNKLRPIALHHVGMIEADNYRNNLAINYYERALQEIGSNNDQERAEIFFSLSKAHQAQQESAKALEYLNKYLKLKSVLETQTSEKLGVADYNKFKESERLKAIEQLDRENKSQEKASKFAKLISILAIALISILSLLSLSLYRNNIIRNESNALLKQKNQELEIARDNAEKASKARSEFLSTVSHELRTPLNAINGITHLLLQENPKEEQLNYLNSLQFSGHYLLTFINEILEFNRLESNSVEVEYIHFNLKELLEKIQNSLKELASSNGNKFIVEIDPEIPNTLIGDPTKLSQIFMNLINNALKFTNNGEVKVVAKVTHKSADRCSIFFEVVDTGIGIPEDKQKSIFDLFSQGSIEINRKYGGTGLGLNITQKLIQMLGSEIQLTSRIGQGSRFFFELDFEISHVEEVKKGPSYDESIFVNKKVLLVEDNKINQMITRKMLEKKQMLITTIDNGEDAIEAVKNNYFDIVLMDVHLPGINGTVATETIRTFDMKTRIIALTAISLNENREMLLSYGMNDVVTKPFDPEVFYRVIAEQLTEIA